MPYALVLASFAIVHLMAAISPGPAFVIVTRISVGQSRRAAVGAALGVAMATVVWAVLATLGMHVLLDKAPWLDSVLKLAGGAYLLWLGVQAWLHAKKPMAPPADDIAAMKTWHAWRLGASINLANPKVIVFFGSIFVALFTPETPAWVRLAALAIVAVNEFLWYLLVALVFSSRPAQAAYRRAKHWLDRVTGTAMMMFGLRLILTART